MTATAYWSPPATLITPALWNPIGQAQYPSVPGGRVVRVSTPGITWSQAAIPVAGHYCHIATVGNAGDPEPTPGTFTDFNAYVAYIEANNNITWRNFNVVSTAHPRTSGPFRGLIALPFLITGAWDDARIFGLEILAQLPGTGSADPRSARLAGSSVQSQADRVRGPRRRRSRPRRPRPHAHTHPAARRRPIGRRRAESGRPRGQPSADRVARRSPPSASRGGRAPDVQGPRGRTDHMAVGARSRPV